MGTETDTKMVGQQVPMVRLRFGNKQGGSFRVKFPELHELSREGYIVEAEVHRFELAAIAFSGDGRNRMFVLEPADAVDRFEIYGFFVEGRFRVTQKVNNPQRASEAFKVFKPR